MLDMFNFAIIVYMECKDISFFLFLLNGVVKVFNHVRCSYCKMVEYVWAAIFGFKVYDVIV